MQACKHLLFWKYLQLFGKLLILRLELMNPVGPPFHQLFWFETNLKLTKNEKGQLTEVNKGTQKAHDQNNHMLLTRNYT